MSFSYRIQRIQMVRYVILFILCLASSVSFAGTWPAIIPTSTIQSMTYGTIYIKQQLIEVGPEVDAIAPKGYVVCINYYISNWDEYYPVSGGRCATSDGSQTQSQLANEAYQANIDLTVVYTGSEGSSPVDKACVAYYYKKGANSGSVISDPAGCVYAPPSTDWCEITTPQITLDHGTLSADKVEGHVSKKMMSVNCVSETNVRFDILSPDGYLHLQPSGKSLIKVNNLPLGSSIDLPAGDSELLISDQLTGVTSEGVNSASTVLVMALF